MRLTFGLPSNAPRLMSVRSAWLRARSPVLSCQAHFFSSKVLYKSIIRGHASQSRADFITKYSVACKEARETHYWLRLLAASEDMPVENLQDLTDEADQIVAILTTIVKKCRAGNEKKRI
jgi:hypothetical protein